MENVDDAVSRMFERYVGEYKKRGVDALSSALSTIEAMSAGILRSLPLGYLHREDPEARDALIMHYQRQVEYYCLLAAGSHKRGDEKGKESNLQLANIFYTLAQDLSENT